MRDLALIYAPSNLGLRPLYAGHEPGTWRAPEALAAAGLAAAVAPAEVVQLPRPRYSSEEQSETHLLNGNTMRAFNLALADTVEDAARRGLWSLVVGGDCSVMLGALAGLRRRGPLSLVHIDGHSDFRHPGNCDTTARLGAVAGMDLALATGRGEALMTEWPAVSGALVPDAQVVQIGERENRNADFAWPDINDTAITRIDVFEARERKYAWVLERTFSVLDRQPTWPFWIHFDVDVLDQAVLPAVDTPGSPGIAPLELTEILRTLVASSRCAGMTLTIFDPDLDKDGQYAALIVRLVSNVFHTADAA